MTLSPDEPTDTTPEEGSTLVPEELQPDTQGLTPEEADEGPAGQGDMDATAYAEELEQERLDDGRAHPEQSLADGAPTEEGFAGEGEGGPTEQGYGQAGLDSETYDNEEPDYPGSDSGRQTAG
ncbi:MAG TPA: hypothetical protein VFK34_13095 [Marmoricola sp.]|jgi:hypothetical protein|nr:hypothetical protein [Marmoricola sp.]